MNLFKKIISAILLLSLFLGIASALAYADSGDGSSESPGSSDPLFHDFEASDSLSSDDYMSIAMYIKSSYITNSQIRHFDPAGEAWAAVSDTYKLTGVHSTVIGTYGVQFSRVTDPLNTANTVLMACTRTVSGMGSYDSTVDVTGDACNAENEYVMQFDYCLDYNYQTFTNKPVLFRACLVADDGTETVLSSATAFGSSADMEFNSTEVTENAFRFNGVDFNSDTWYTFKIIWTRDTNTVSFYYSTDGGESFSPAGNNKTLSSTASLDNMRLRFPVYHVTAIQYFDNLSYDIPLASPEEVFDFSGSDALATNKNIAYTMFLKNTALNGNVNVEYDPAGEEWANIPDSYKLTNNYSTVIGANGVQFYQGTDPKNAANSALMVCTRTTLGANDSTVEIVGDAITSTGSYVAEFDYYLDYTKAANKPVLNLNLIGESGTAYHILKFNPNLGYSADGSSGMAFNSTVATEDAFKYNGVYLDSDTWYTFRIIWNNGYLNYYYSTDGVSFTQAGNAVALSIDENVTTMRFNFPVYAVTAIQYLDNISFIKPTYALKELSSVEITGNSSEDVLAESDMQNLYNHFVNYITLKSVDVNVFLGDLNTDESNAAYTALDGVITEAGYAGGSALSEAGMGAYVIYAQNNALYVAYTDLYARGAALNYIYENLTASALENGIVSSGTINVSEFIDEMRVEIFTEKLEAQTDKLGAGVVEALIELYSFYDDDLYFWLASLYDPEIGGFYYSLSGRDNRGFLPDLESTAQALELLDKSGLDGDYNDYFGDALPVDTKLDIYNFAISLLADDGYYYHPQWGTNINSSRKGRDKGWGNQIINAFGYLAEGANTAALYLANPSLTDSLTEGTSSAAAKVVATSRVVAAASDTFTNWDSLKAYIDSHIADSYSLGNTLNANIGTIQNAGLRDELVAYLATLQYENGLWEEEISYNAINGLMKMCGFWGGNYGTFPRASAALDSLVSIILGDAAADGLDEEELAELETIAYVYNSWVIMYKLVGHLSDEEKAEFASTLAENSGALLGNVATMFNVFKKPDGGFSYYQDRTSNVSQGVPVAIAGTAESDVNSTAIAVSTLRYIIRVYQLYGDYEFDVPTIYSRYDMATFLGLLDAREPVEKIVVITPPETITFEEEVSEDAYVGGVLLQPHSSASTTVGDKDLDENGNYKWFSSSIVTNPTNAADKVLKAETFVEADEIAAESSSTNFNITNAGADGECYIFDADIYVESGNGTIAQILFATKIINTALQSASFNLETYTSDEETYLRLTEATYYLGGDAVSTTLAEGIAIQNWFNLRLELYREYSEDGSAVSAMYVKVYINDVFVGETLTGRYSSAAGYHNYLIDTVRVSYDKTGASVIYLDNVYTAKSDAVYLPASAE